MTAEVAIPDGGAEGVIIAQGGRFGGWSLYLRDGRPAYTYNLLGRRHFDIDGDTPVPPGTHQVRMELTYDGGGLGQGATAALYVDGSKSGEGRLDATVPLAFSGDETCDIGSDTASPVSERYTPAGSRFTGTVEWVQIDIADAAEHLDHLISAEQRLNIAMARQ